MRRLASTCAGARVARVCVLAVTALCLVSGTAVAASAQVATGADLAVTLSAPAVVTEGDVVEFTVVVRNDGPEAASNVRFSNPIDPAFAWIGFGDVDGFDSCGRAAAGNVISCSVSPLPRGASATAVFRFRATRAGTYTNSVQITSTTPDPDVSDNVGSSTVLVRPRLPDLAVTKAGPASVLAGDELVFTIGVRNDGTRPAENVRLSDALGAGFAFVSLTPLEGFQSCGPPSPPADVASCTIASLAPGARATAELRVRAIAPGPQTNTAEATSTTQDSDPSNNAASATVVVQPRLADVSVTKTVAVPRAIVGEEVAYTIAVANAGPQEADTLRLVDRISDGVELVAIEAPSGFDCTAQSSVVTCDAAVLGPGASGSVVVRVRPTRPGPVKNTAEATSLTADPDGSNNVAAATLDVIDAIASAPDLLDADDTGVSATDDVTRVARPRFAVTTDPGLLVELVEDGVVLGEAIADEAGSAVVMPVAPLADGTHELVARARLGAATGPVSDPVSVVIDTTGPVISTTSPVDGAELDIEQHVPVSFAIEDAVGVAAVEATLDGQPIAEGDVLATSSLALGTHTITVSATDVAGNATTSTTEFAVVPTLDGLAAAVDSAVASGLIAPQMSTPLLAKIRAARNGGALDAFVDHVRAQRGHKVDASYADRLVAWAEAVAARS